MVGGGEQHPERSDLRVVRASLRELDVPYTLVEELTDGTRRPKRRDLLAGTRASRCGAVDGL